MPVDTTGFDDRIKPVRDEWFHSVGLKFHMTVWEAIPGLELVRVDKFNNPVAVTVVETKGEFALDAGNKAGSSLPT